MQPNEAVEKASCDIALVMIAPQDRGIENFWESMPRWPLEANRYQSEVYSRRSFPPVVTRHLRKQSFSEG
jgi:hypothetical protein